MDFKPFLLFVFLLATNYGYAQKYIQLEKYGNPNVHRYYIGDQIIYQVKGSKSWYVGEIGDMLIQEKIIYLNNTIINLNQITAVKTTENRKGSKALGNSLLFASANWFVYSGIAAAVSDWKFDESTVIIGGSAAIAGLGIKALFNSKKHKLGKRKFLRMYHIPTSLEELLPPDINQQ